MTDTNGRSLTELVETTDEEGVTHYFEKIEEFECDSKPYALLIYRGTSNDDPEADEEGFDEEYVVMRVAQEDGELAYEYIEDEEEFKKAIAHLETLDYDFDTDDDEDEDDAYDDDDEEDVDNDVLVIRNDPSLN